MPDYPCAGTPLCRQQGQQVITRLWIGRQLRNICHIKILILRGMSAFHSPLAMSSAFPSVNLSYKDFIKNFREEVSFHAIESFSWLRLLPSRSAMSAAQVAASPVSRVLKKAIARGCTHRASATRMLVSVASWYNSGWDCHNGA
jgi:hypothetical protein